MRKKFLVSILIIFFLSHLLFRIYSYRERYLTAYDPGYWKTRYLQSQWVDSVSKNPIGDDGLYAYTAWEYISGTNPVLLNPEVPFLGKYLLGYSILLFRNENIFALIIGMAVLLTLFFLNRSIFTDRLTAFVPVLIFSLEPLFYEQLRAPFFDLLHLLFLLLFLWAFIKNKYWLSSFFLGCFAAVKFPFMAVIPVAAAVCVLYISGKKRKILNYAGTLPLAILVYVLTYIRFFLLGNTFYQFLQVQKFVLNFYLSGAKTPFYGTVFPLLFSGTWFTHFGTVEKVSEWNILWPAAAIIALFVFRYLHRANKAIRIMIIWVIIFLLFLSLTPLFPRYLLLLLPFLYNLSIWVISYHFAINHK